MSEEELRVGTMRQMFHRLQLCKKHEVARNESISRDLEAMDEQYERHNEEKTQGEKQRKESSEALQRALEVLNGKRRAWRGRCKLDPSLKAPPRHHPVSNFDGLKGDIAFNLKPFLVFGL